MKQTKPIRVERIPVINTSRAGLQYIKYIDPLRKSTPGDFMGFTPEVINRSGRAEKGRSFKGGRYYPRPTFHVGINPATGRQFVQTIHGKPKL